LIKDRAIRWSEHLTTISQIERCARNLGLGTIRPTYGDGISGICAYDVRAIDTIVAIAPNIAVIVRVDHVKRMHMQRIAGRRRRKRVNQPELICV
jgi:hypothetical protein